MGVGSNSLAFLLTHALVPELGLLRLLGVTPRARVCDKMGQSCLSCQLLEGCIVRTRPVCIPSHRVRPASALTSSECFMPEKTRAELSSSA